ncbi:GEN endonuclease, partial [Upupa epops]|nr:GEN endonuclease [Upupa epops]
GVPGVGKEQALKLIETLQGQNLLERFQQWKEQFQCDNSPPFVTKRVIHCSECHHPGSHKEHEHSGCTFCESTRYCKSNDSKYSCPCEWHQLDRVKQASAVEDSIRKKANSCEGFPFSEVIQEFLVNKNKLINIKECQRPNLLSFQIFASEKMEWPKHYACKKLLTLLTRYDMIQRKSGYVDSKQLQAIRIVKTRIKNGMSCFEIAWQKPEHYVDAEDESAELFVVTVEEESLFQAAYPDVVALYQAQQSEILKKKQKSKKDRPKEKELMNVYDEVSDLLSQMNLKSRNIILPVQYSSSDTKMHPENQLHRSTQSKDSVLPVPSCITTVPVPASAAALPPTASSYSFLKSLMPDASVWPAQLTKNSGISSSSPAADCLQLSDIDWKGTSFSTSPAAHGDDTHDPAADLTTCVKHSHPLPHETIRSSSEYSDAMRSDRCSSDSADYLFSDDNTGKLQQQSLSERIFKTSIPSLSEDTMQLDALKCFKQRKETLNPDRDYVFSSYQLDKLVQESKNVLSENYVKESNVHVHRGQHKKADSLDETMQEDNNRSNSRSVALSGQKAEALHPAHEVIPVSQKLANIVTGCHMTKACTQTTWKTSFKKSVCQNKCSSSEDSDIENMNKDLIYEQQKRQPNPGQIQKCFRKKKSKIISSKRTNSNSALVVKGEKKETKKAVSNFLLQVSPNPSSVEKINCSRSPEQLFEMSGSGRMPQVESAAMALAWADSPLPLSERLKGRIKIN